LDSASKKKRFVKKKEKIQNLGDAGSLNQRTQQRSAKWGVIRVENKKGFSTEKEGTTLDGNPEVTQGATVARSHN